MSPTSTSTSTARRPAPSGQPRATRGATMVEYAVLLVAVVLIGAGSIKLLGTTLGKRGAAAGEVVSGAETDTAVGGASPNAGVAGSDGKASVAAKMGVSGVGGGAAAGGAAVPRAREHDVERGPPSDDHALVEGFSAKRWLAVGLLLAGLVALGFVIVSVRRAKLAALATSRDAGPPR